MAEHFSEGPKTVHWAGTHAVAHGDPPTIQFLLKDDRGEIYRFQMAVGDAQNLANTVDEAFGHYLRTYSQSDRSRGTPSERPSSRAETE